MYKPLCLLLCFIALVLLDCTMQPLAGGSSQQGNGIIIGSVTYAGSGLPLSKGVVRLRPAGFLRYQNGSFTQLPASRCRNLLTDGSGGFTIANIDTGSYRIEVSDDEENGASAVVLECRITPVDSVAVIPAGFLRPVGSIHGSYASLPDRASSIYLQIFGLDRVARIDTAAKTFTFDDVPAGTYSAAIASLAQGTVAIAALNHCTVTSGARLECGVIDLQSLDSWRHSRRLYLNTTQSGADVPVTVTQFPVLVRLSSGNFSFAEALSTGADIRFVKSDGAILPSEIELWDPVTAQAAIWVNVDTVYGNDSSHFITMYWGTSATDSTGSPQGSVTSISNSQAVFDTANGFQGVWHLDEPASAPVKDATVNRYDGTPSDTAPAPAQGTVGMAQEFDGISNFIQLQGTANSKLNFPQNGSYTVSAWIYSDTLDDNWHVIVGKGHEQYHLKQQNLFRYGNWEFVEYQDQTEWQITETPVVTRTWKYLTGVRNNNKQYFYLDGMLVDSVISGNPYPIPRYTGYDVSIGSYTYYVTYTNEGYCRFKGRIDEVRISSSARSGNWEKLCYMNQRKDERLILFK